MGLYDQHLHSWNSFDCQTPPADNAARALELGLGGLTFTEHFDTHPNEWPNCRYDDDKIAREIGELRARFGNRLFIGKGIEVCYQPERMDFILDFLAAHRFDLVLCSVHWAFGKAVHEAEHFERLGPERFIAYYLDAVADATEHLLDLKRAGRLPFHVLGHLDYAKRYALSHCGYRQPVMPDTTVDRILRNCLAADVVPEINTSVLRHGLGEPMPGAGIIRRYAELGGTMMSLGSDAHAAASIGARFDVAVELMRQAGLRGIAVFRGGNRHAEPLAAPTAG